MSEYLVPGEYGEAEYCEKRSRFLGRVWRVETEDAALSKIKEMREAYRDASHNVYAYLIHNGSLMRYSDDGEPQGTAGLPLLNVLRGAELTNVICIVTRWFGGTLLGTGGLARAYAHAASAALDAAGICVMRTWVRIGITCPYNLFERVQSEILAAGGTVINNTYAADVTIEAMLPEECAEIFGTRLSDISSGTLSFVNIADN